MDKYLFTIILYILKYWPWPIMVLFLTFLFKTSILNILSRIGEIRFGNTSVKIYEAKENANRLFGKKTDDKSSDDPISITGTIVNSWKEIETELNNIAIKNGFTHQGPVMASTEIRFLESKGFLSNEQVKLLSNLRRIKNEAVHIQENQLTAVDAHNYSDAASVIISSLQSL